MPAVWQDFSWLFRLARKYQLVLVEPLSAINIMPFLPVFRKQGYEKRVPLRITSLKTHEPIKIPLTPMIAAKKLLSPCKCINKTQTLIKFFKN